MLRRNESWTKELDNRFLDGGSLNNAMGRFWISFRSREHHRSSPRSTNSASHFPCTFRCRTTEPQHHRTCMPYRNNIEYRCDGKNNSSFCEVNAAHNFHFCYCVSTQFFLQS